MVGNIWTKEFWKAATERAIRTAAQAILLVLIGDVARAYGDVNVFGVDWVNLLGFGLGGLLLGYLFSIVGNATTKSGPSFNQAEVVVPPAAIVIPGDGAPPVNP
jgi:Putative lactococcus lactis phage r1t holin